MKHDFSIPQRQSAVGIVSMATNTTYKIIKASFFPIIALLVKSEAQTLKYVALGFVALLCIVVFFSYLWYKNFTFYLDQNRQEFIVKKGIFSKKLITINLNKILHVNVNQSFLQKIIGVYELKIDTAGTEKNEVDIKAIDGILANQLRAYLLNKENNEQSQIASSHPQEQNAPTLVKISFSTLLKVGLTTNYENSIALFIGFVYTIYHNAKEFVKIFKEYDEQVESGLKNGFELVSNSLFITVVFTVIMVVLLVINLVRTFIKYYKFQIVKNHDSLLISRGLLATKNSLLKPNKVQSTSYSQNFFQKKMGIYNITMKQAHNGKAQNEKELNDNNLEIPGCSPNERNKILELILGQLPQPTQYFKPDVRFLNLPLFFGVIFPVGIYVCFCFIFETTRSFYPLAILYVLISALIIYVSYRRHTLMVDNNFIIKKSGFWDVSHEIIFPHKIQSISTFQYPWHKSIDIGHVSLHTAAGTINYKFGNYTQIKKMVNYWLYEVEKNNNQWI